MNLNEFTPQIEVVRRRVATIRQIAHELLPMQPPKLLEEAFEELDTALEDWAIAHEVVEVERQRYQDLFEEAPDGYLVTDAQGTIQSANRAAESLLNVPPNQLVGKPLVLFVPEEEQQFFLSQLGCLCKIGPVQEWELRLRPRDDDYFDAAVTVAAVRNEQDQPVALRWLLRDITDRLRTEVLQTRVRVLESMVEGVNVSDENGVIFLTNPAFDAMFGYGTGELLGKHVSVLNAHPPAENAGISGEILEQLQAQGAWVGEFHNRKKDGTLFITYVRCSTLEISGKEYWVSVHEDITERKQAVKALRESEERYRAVVKQTSEGIFLIDVETKRLLEANAAFGHLLGYTSEEILKLRLYDIVAHERSSIDFNVQTIVAQKHYSIGERRYRRKDGTLVDVEVSANLISYGDREVICAVVRDITTRKQALEALRESEERYRRIIETTSEGVWITDAENKTVFANSRLALMLGYTLDEMQGQSLFAFMDEEYQALAAAAFQRHRSGIAETLIDVKLRRKDGSQLWVMVTANPIFDQAGHYAGCLGMLTDITSRKQAEEALRQAEQKYHSIFENAVEGIFQSTVDGHFLTANPMLAQIYGYDSPEDLITTLSDIAHQLYVDPNRRVEFRRLIQEQGTICDFESQVYCKDGRVIWISENAHALYDARGQILGYEGTVVDITSRKQAEAMIRYQAFHDLLTGLPNRTLFNEQLLLSLACACNSRNMLAVMFLDLDRFKTINDTLGHAFGDRLLQCVAERLRGCLHSDDILARWGGDEFTLALPQIKDAESAALVAQQILDSLKPAFNLDGHELYISSSIGIALYPQDGEDVQTLLRKADISLYRAKEHGRNNYRFYIPAMNSQANELLTLENQLHHALKREEFVVYYQPQVNIKTGEIATMEALVRWQHPTLGLISPGTFIPLAEENGLIVPLGEWVLKTACAQNKAWQSAGFAPLRVAVNLSARQFLQPNLVTTVARVLEETGLLPSFLELEITETTIMQNVDFAKAMLRDLHRMGVHISMDDFGTGYSSLGYLKKFPFHTIKIDQSFVRDLTADPQDTAIISAVLALGSGLNLRVVAEGVETKEQFQLLQSLQCEEMQGYLFSRPVSFSQATHILRKCWLQALLVALQKNEESFSRQLV